MSRRPASIVTLVLALVLAACGHVDPSPSGSGGPNPSASGSGEPSTPVTGGTLTVGLSAEAESMDPALVYQSAGQSLMFALYDTVLTIAPDGSLGPGIATDWTIVNPTTIELTLRDDVAFHDGEPLDAAAIRFSIYRILDWDPETGDPIADDASRLNSQWARDFGAVESIDAPDATTLVLNLSRPDAALLNALGRTFVVPPGTIGDLGNDGFAENPVGSGPFRFVERVVDDHTTLTSNPNYWDSPRGLPLVDEVVFRPIPDASTRLNELTTGGVDLIQDPPADQLDRIGEDGGRLVTIPDGRRYLIWFSLDGKGAVAENPTPQQARALEALARPEVREALNLAVDRNLIIDTLLDEQGAPMTGPLVEGDLGWDAGHDPIPYDPDRARQLLAEAGYADGFTVDLDVCTCDRSDLPEAIQGELAKVGVTVNLVPAEISQFNADWGAGRQNPMRASRLSFSDPNVYLQLWLRTGGLLSRYSDPELDALIDAQAAEYDRDARAEILGEIDGRVRGDLPALFLWSSPNLYGAGPAVPEWSPHLLGYLPVTGVGVQR